MDLSVVLGIVAVVLILFGKPIFTRLQYAYANLSQKLPSIGGIFAAEVTIPVWKAVALIPALWLISGGVAWQGCTLPDVPWVTPGGDPSPIPDAGLRVLITYSDEHRGDLPAGQKKILDSVALRTWLDAHCVKDPSGVPEWRVEKDTTFFKSDQPIWQKLMGVKRDATEWLVVADGKHGKSIPLPADEAALMAVLTPFGGGK